MSSVLVPVDLHDPRWLSFVDGHPHATYFHRPAWAQLVADCYGYRTFALVSRDDARIVAGLPVVDVSTLLAGRRWVSLPFTDYCPPLVAGDESEFIASLVEMCRERRVGRLEIRASLPQQPPIRSQAVGVRHTLPLDGGSANAFARLTKMHQRNVRVAERAGVRVRLGTTADDVETFYRLHLLTRHRQGVPIQPRRFFRLLAERVIARRDGFVLTAFRGARPLASAVFLAWNGVLIYKYAASDEHTWPWRPNNLLCWTAIQWGCDHGYREVDWGRVETDQVGLRAFKCGWGSAEADVAYSSIGGPLRRSSAGPFKHILAAAIRRSNPWLCRVLGEVLYKYAA